MSLFQFCQLLNNIQELFRPHYTRFLLNINDIPPVKRAKLQLLLMLASTENIQTILRELVVRTISLSLGFPLPQVTDLGFQGLRKG